jgi:uncharacterized membrane protein
MQLSSRKSCWSASDGRDHLSYNNSQSAQARGSGPEERSVDVSEWSVDSGGTGARLSATTRVEAFSDGVMAIAITLLVLEVRLPADDHGPLLRELARLWPSYLAYLDSFLTIGVVWLCHHAFFSRIRQVDALLAWDNLVLLMTVAFVPFPTSVLAARLADGGAEAGIAAAFYGLVAAAQAAAWLIMWAALRRRPGMFERGYDARFARVESRMAWLGVAVFLGCAAIGLVSAWASVTFYVLAVIGYGLTAPGWHSARARLRGA